MGNVRRKNSKKKSKYTKWLYVIPVILWMIFIFYMSSQDGDESSSTSGVISDFIVKLLEKIRNDLPNEQEALSDVVSLYVRKLAHMFEYAILFLLTYLAANKIGDGEDKSSKGKGNIFNKTAAVLISFFYACTDEIHQLMISGRAGRMTDVMIDMIGVLIVLLLMAAFKSSKWRVITCALIAFVVVGIFVYLLIGNFG